MKVLIRSAPLALLLLLFCPMMLAQNQRADGTLTAQDSGACTTAGACLSLRLNSNAGASVVQLTGTFSGTVQFEGSADGNTWVAIAATPVAGGSAVTSATGTGAWGMNVSGLSYVRARCSTYTSGTVQVTITSSVAAANSRGGGGGGGGSGTVSNCTTQYAIFYAATTGTTATCTPNILMDLSVPAWPRVEVTGAFFDPRTTDTGATGCVNCIPNTALTTAGGPLIEDGDFEEWYYWVQGATPINFIPGWTHGASSDVTLSIDTTTPYQGLASLIVTTTAGAPANEALAYPSSIFSVIPGQTYSFSVYAHGDGTTAPKVILDLSDSNGTTLTTLSATGTSSTSWQHLTASGTAASGATLGFLELGPASTTSAAVTEFDAVQVYGPSIVTGLVDQALGSSTSPVCPNGTGGALTTTGCAGANAFSSLTGGTNTGAAMVVGTGASLGVTGSGTIDATTLGGKTFAAPAAIGSGTPAGGSFTTLSASSTVSGTGFSTYLASPPAIGGTAPAGGAFTTLSASSTVAGTGFSTYLASPPAIGGTAPAAGTFTTLGGTFTAHGVLLGEGTGANIAATAAGTAGQPFLSGGASADGAYGALNVGTSAVTGTGTPLNGFTGLSNPTAHSLMISEGSSPFTLLTSPSLNGNYTCGFNVTASAALDPSCALEGIPVVAETTNDNLAYNYRAAFLRWSGGTTATLTMGAATGNLASNMPFVAANFDSGNLTLTATSPNTIDGGSAGGSVTVLPNWARFVYQDSTPNWFTLAFPTISAFPTCGDATHALNFTATGIGCQAISATASAGGLTTQVQYNNAGALGGIAQWTTNGTTTMTGSSTAVLNLSGMAPASGLDLPQVAGAIPTTDGFIGVNLTTHALAWGSNGTTIVGAAAATGTGTSTACASHNWVSTVSAVAVPSCTQPAFTDISGTAATTQIPATAVSVDTTTPITVSTTNASEFYNNQNATAATAVTYNLPTAAAGKQFCFTNSYNGSAADTGVLTVATSATGQFIIFTDGTLSATGGNVTSGGAAGDASCVVGVDSTHWQLYVQRGTWTKH